MLFCLTLVCLVFTCLCLLVHGHLALTGLVTGLFVVAHDGSADITALGSVDLLLALAFLVGGDGQTVWVRNDRACLQGKFTNVGWIDDADERANKSPLACLGRSPS